MFENLDDLQRKKLRESWGEANARVRGIRGEFKKDRWYTARIERVETGVKHGKPRTQVFFDVEGVLLVKDFWLTEKGVFVFRAFLKKVGVRVEDLEKLRQESLPGKCVEVQLKEKHIGMRSWVEIEKVR